MVNNWAIVIGINYYDHLAPERHLRFAVKDAEKMREFLCDHAGFPSQNILLCTDASQPVGHISTRPALTNLQRLLLEHIQHATEADNFWFFFAGHGMVGDDCQDYLLPCDGYPRYLKGSAIPITFVTECLRNCHAKNIVLILDMCRQEWADSSRDIGTEVGEQTIEIAKQQGIITIFSCNRGQFSYEIPDLQHGAFTYTLLQGLQRHTILRQLGAYLNREVPIVNRKYNIQVQIPRIVAEPAGKYDLPLLSGYTTNTDVAVLSNQATQAELEAVTEEEYRKAKDLWWQVIEGSQSREQIARARGAIDRIDRKVAQLQRINFPPKPPTDSPSPAPEAIPSPATHRASEQVIPPIEVKPPSAPPKSSPTSIEEGDDLSSERFGANYYTKLRDLLKEGKWQEADQETADRMCEVMDRQKEGWLDVKHIQNFPCQDLRTIDRLWVKYSNGKFGFSVQKKIYLACGAKPDGKYPGDKIWYKFCERVGWRVNGRWIISNDVTFDTSAPLHLPRGAVRRRVGCYLFSRTDL